MLDKDGFARFLRPSSVAVVGASPQRGNPRNTLVRNLVKHAFPGDIYPVSRSSSEVEGLRAYQNVSDLPSAPDVALVITPAETVPAIILECGARGIRNAVVFSSGFEEVEGGAGLATQLSEAARQYGMNLLGPNCQGLWSVRDRAMLTFSPAILNREVLRYAPIGIISQSGALAGAMTNALENIGMGCSCVVTVGNETCLDALDILSAMIEQDDIRAIGLYLEGLNDAARILKIADRARVRGVQIVVLKAGRSAFGQMATASHTGKIASAHAVYADLLDQAGIISVESLVQLIAALEVLAFLPHPRAGEQEKSGVSVMSSSGGAAALLADLSSERQIPMAEFSAATTERLAKVLPSFARNSNPIDLTGQVNTNRTLFKEACEAIVADRRTEVVVVQFSASGRRYLEENGEVFKSLAQEVPVVVSFIGEMMEPEVRRGYREAGVLLCGDPSFAMEAVTWLYRRRAARDLPTFVNRPALRDLSAPRDWQETMKLLQSSSIGVAPWTILSPGQDAAEACASLTYPLVVKALPSDSEHKTELGLVRLRVRTPQEVDAIAADFRRRLNKPKAGILVQEMIEGGIEVVLSCLRNSDFGPIMSIGSGGVAIELYGDVGYVGLPTSTQKVLAVLNKLKVGTLLNGFRGKPPADLEALATAAVALGDTFLATPAVQELEINPVIVHEKGKGLSAVDVLVVGS